MSEHEKRMTIPDWAVGTAKFAGTVVCAVAIGYARFVGTENKVDENRRMILEMKGVDAAQTELINAMDRRLHGSETAQKINDTSTRDALARIEASTKDSLGRIESMVKEVRSDVRELQQKNENTTAK